MHAGVWLLFWRSNALLTFLLSICRRKSDLKILQMAYEDYDRTIEMLNDSMGLCLK